MRRRYVSANLLWPAGSSPVNLFEDTGKKVWRSPEMTDLMYARLQSALDLTLRYSLAKGKESGLGHDCKDTSEVLCFLYDLASVSHTAA
jgi:hypothetical protein